MSEAPGNVTVVAAPDILIRAKGLTKTFGDFTAVAGIDFELTRGEVFGFLGPNGAGKSSTMRMIGCVSPPSGGELSIFGLDPVRDGQAIRARLGVVPQEDTLDVELTVRENLLIYGRYFGLRRDVIRERTARLLEFVQLTERADDEVEPLSGGMKRRLTIARSLISDPEVLLLDEPTTGLDPQARHVVWDRLYRLKQQGVTLVLTTHYMDEAEPADRIALIDQGLILALGTPRDLKNQVGGGVLLLATEDDARAADWLRAHDHRPEAGTRGLLLVEHEPAAVLPRILAQLPVRTQRAEIHEPSLEDVFLKLTGRSLEDGSGKLAPRASEGRP